MLTFKLNVFQKYPPESASGIDQTRTLIYTAGQADLSTKHGNSTAMHRPKYYVSLTVHGRFRPNHYSKMGCEFGFGLGVGSVQGQCQGQNQGQGQGNTFYQGLQVKSGHAAATTSHPYFGVMVWPKSTGLHVIDKLNAHGGLFVGAHR